MIKVKTLDGQQLETATGTSLLDLIDQLGACRTSKIIVGKVNNKVVDLHYKVHSDAVIDFLDMSTREGIMAYYRSLTFVLAKAVAELMPREELVVDHSISKGLYCHFKREHPLSDRGLSAIEDRMRQIVAANLPFIRYTYPVGRAVRIFEESGQIDKADLLRTICRKRVNLYSLDNSMNYFYGPLVPTTDYLYCFKLHSYPPGFILRFPHQSNPEQLPPLELQPRLFAILQEHEQWGQILGVEDVARLNHIIATGAIKEFILIAEALHAEKIVKIAETIYKLRQPRLVVLIAGPSSSGKTTFSKRLYIQLRVFGFKPATLSVDDYFLDREFTPKDEHGNYDFESVRAIDLKLLNSHLLQLMDGREVEIPKFDFTRGQKINDGRKIQLDNSGIILIEGIHCLNDELTPSIPLDLKYKIYISALTHINIDNHNRIPTTDTRLIRRLVRDMNSRGYSPLDTLRRWPLVRQGEERNIFPFQENANVMFNSALFYELAVLKRHAEQLLFDKIPRSEPEYSEARRLLKFLSYFRHASSRPVPNDSILREFIDQSVFDY